MTNRIRKSKEMAKGIQRKKIRSRQPEQGVHRRPEQEVNRRPEQGVHKRREEGVRRWLEQPRSGVQTYSMKTKIRSKTTIRSIQTTIRSTEKVKTPSRVQRFKPQSDVQRDVWL